MPSSSLRFRVSIFVVSLLALIIKSNGVTIMSLDFGSEWLKIGVVAPGIPMEIALNKESKRKTPATISFRDGERAFGEDAVVAGMKSPSSSYAYVLDLLGKTLDSPIIELYKRRFPYYNFQADSERGTVLFRQDEETTYTVEELVAQILDHARDIAMAHTNQKIKDIVITVPAYFNQAERRSLLAAAELADLKVLSLMSTNAAVALNYGMFRRKSINETVQNILFYDMGASSTVASIASYQTVKTKERGYTETNPQVTILGVGYDRTLGGLEMQLRVRDFLARKFNDMKKTSKDVFEHPRAMGKLMKEAAKLKTVLSANTEYLSQVEGVLDDQDFRLLVLRQEFEDLCQDLFARVEGPVDGALISAGMDISNIDQFIIMGGNTRVPKVQAILQGLWKKELGKNINADEAAALGAAYRAADLGQGFKVMKFHIKESVLYPIEVEFARKAEKEDGAQTSRVVKRSLFALLNSYPQKKVMTFNRHIEDFGFSVNYGDLSHLTKDQVSGVHEAFQKHLADGAESKGIKAHFSLDESGILDLTGVEAIFEKNVTIAEEKEEESTISKIGSTISRLFSGSDDDDEQQDTQNATSADEVTNATKMENTTDKKANGEAKKDKSTKEDDSKTKDAVKEKFKLVTVKTYLNITVNFLDLKMQSEQKKKESMEKIRSISAAEEVRQEKERLKNGLETYILDIQDKFSQEDYLVASTEEIRQNILDTASQQEEWLYDEGSDAEPSLYTERLKALQKEFEPIKARVKEHRDRPEALKALHDMINASSIFLYRAENAPDAEKYFTDVELKTLNDLIIDTENWMEMKEEEQENTPLHENPKLTIMSIAEKMAALDREIKYLLSKGKNVKAKKEKEEAAAKLKELEEKLAEERAKRKKNETEAEVDDGRDNATAKEPFPPTDSESNETEPQEKGEKNEEEEIDESTQTVGNESTPTIERETHTEL